MKDDVLKFLGISLLVMIASKSQIRLLTRWLDAAYFTILFEIYSIPLAFLVLGFWLHHFFIFDDYKYDKSSFVAQDFEYQTQSVRTIFELSLNRFNFVCSRPF